MKVTELCKARWQLAETQPTPLLVPSFSSRGLPFLNEVHGSILPFITRASLVSAFDIFHGHLDVAAASSSDVVFVDSGGYEYRRPPEPFEAYRDDAHSLSWDLAKYEEVLTRLPNAPWITVVSFDSSESLCLSDQIASASELFARFPAFSSDFLWKPVGSDRLIGDPAELAPYADSLMRFDILGVADKELGNSVVERCRKIAVIRTELSSAGIHLPLHVFGCLDQVTSVAYFLCGADVFDGLSWLRYAFRGEKAFYLQQGPFLEGTPELSDSDFMLHQWVVNLEVLLGLQDSMLQFTKSYDHSVLGLTESTWNTVLNALERASISVQGVT